MRLYVMSETLCPDGTVLETRERQLVLQTPQTVSIGAQRLRALLPSLAVLCAIPASAHEANLKALLNQTWNDAVALPSYTHDPSEHDDDLTLKICRISQGADTQQVYQLRYVLMEHQAL